MTLEVDKLLDETGWRILQALQENARLSFSELGLRVGLSSPAVAERVRRLEDAGIIKGYRAEIDTTKVGYPITAIIRMQAQGDRCTRISAFVRDIPEVLECYRVTGSDCLIMKVMVSCVEHLEVLIDRLSVHGPLTTSIVLSTPITKGVIVPVSDPAIQVHMEESA
jgi:Lrp/AsnC family transcriptional regulator, leucine-responsive regulatory protein